MSFPMSFHQAVLRPSGAYWLDDSSDLSCKESTRQYAVDGSRLSCKQQVPGSSPSTNSKSRKAQKLRATFPAWKGADRRALLLVFWTVPPPLRGKLTIR
jgi:hypothetical protein